MAFLNGSKIIPNFYYIFCKTHQLLKIAFHKSITFCRHVHVRVHKFYILQNLIVRYTYTFLALWCIHSLDC